MAEVIPAEEQSNYETFRDCLSEPVLRALAAPVEKPIRKRRKKDSKKGLKNGNVNRGVEQSRGNSSGGASQTDDAEDLGEFIDYLSTLLFPCLPAPLRTLTHSNLKGTPYLQETYSLPLSSLTITTLLQTISPTATENLESYALLPYQPDATDLFNYFTPIFTAYITSTTAPPPIWSLTRTTECELCHREWIPLTYHHLIPKVTHERVLKRGWHSEEKLNAVAWLCRACHSFVHRIARNEELARSWYSVELLESREDVQAWVSWVGRVRWKAR